jgi:hypothetical protein
MLNIKISGKLYFRILEEAGKNELEPEEIVKKILAERLNVPINQSDEKRVEKKAESIFKLDKGTQKSKDIKAVIKKMKNQMSYTQAIKERAKERNVTYQTIADKCTRQLGLTSEEFKEEVKKYILKRKNSNNF